MRVAEIYKSRQGEGELTGVESVFVRVAGCNLRCIWCDTPYASWEPTGPDRAIADIAAKVLQFDVEHVVLTGGEPMLFSELIPLCELLRNEERHLTIETAGTLHLPVACDLMSVSPKFSNSAPPEKMFPKWHRRHERQRHVPTVIRKLISQYRYQFKFVVETSIDIVAVKKYCDEFPELDRTRVWLMPQARSVEEHLAIEAWLPEACKRLGVQFCPRRQIEWYGCRPGT